MISTLLSVCSAAALAPFLTATSQGDGALDGDRLVKMEVFADRSAIRPGERFTLGVRMKIERGWHIYWENPGDSGLATRVDVRGPSGFEVGPTRFPAPERFEAPGDIVTFVHQGELVLLRDVVAPNDLAASAPARFEIDGRWLACIEICLPGSYSTELTLPVGARDSAPQLANEKLFVEWREKLPKPWPSERATTYWSKSEDRHILALTVPDATSIEFFPRLSEVVHLKHQRFEHGKLELEFTLEPLRAGDSIPERVSVDGIVRAHGANGAQAFELVAPFPDHASTPPKKH